MHTDRGLDGVPERDISKDRVTESPPPPIAARLVARRQLAPGVVLLRFRAEPAGPLRWQPGQHLTLSTAEAPELGIPYSIASALDPARAGEFELAVSANGGQDLLGRLHPDSKVFVSTPKGQFVWAPALGATLLVGMGTGLAPLRAMLQARLAQPGCDEVTLLFGARSESDILFNEEFSELAERDPRFSFQPTLSRPGSSWHGRVGRVQDHLRALVSDPAQLSAYVCGSREMVADCVARLTGPLGLDPARVRSEAH